MRPAKYLSLVAISIAPTLFGEDEATVARAAAGCGSIEARYTVKTDKKHHPVGQADPGKALVYFFGEQRRIYGETTIGQETTRWGIDGTWVGATNLDSYFYVPLDPGDHHICTSYQSRLKVLSKISAAITVTAEAGKVYYFRLKPPYPPEQPQRVELLAVDPAAAQLLIANFAFAASRPK